MVRRWFAVARTLVVAPLFVSLWMWFLPRWLAGREAFHELRPTGWLVIAVGLAIMAACVAVFAWIGRGTPAPFDPPRHLVVAGPYRFVRNPMYIGMGIALLGEAIAYPRLARVLGGEAVVAFVLVSILIVVYEEPALRTAFGSAYDAYCRQVPRWRPRLTPFDNRNSAA